MNKINIFNIPTYYNFLEAVYYWLEENLFSDLFYNEKRNNKFNDSSPGVPAVPLAPATVVNYYNSDKFKLYPSIPLLNDILKNSFKKL